MEDLVSKVKKALSAYCQRGEAALAHLDGGQEAEALRALRLRKAAFYNFRLFDAQAIAANIDITNEPEMKRLWQRIQETDRKLQAALQQAKADAAHQQQRLRDARRSISNYHSGSITRSMFEETA